MEAVKRILVGEGSAEPTTGFEFIQHFFSGSPVEFYFGVRRCPDGLDTINGEQVSAIANFPGRGMSGLRQTPRACIMSSYTVTQMIDSGRLQPDALLVVASPPDAKGRRSLGTANGPLQSAIDHAPLVIVEEWANLPVIAGAATIPADKPVHVLEHKPATFAPLSRTPEGLDYACAELIAELLDDNIALQIGVGGIIEALGESLKSRRGLRIITGAVGSTIKLLDDNDCLSRQHPIMGTALVGDQEIMDWAAAHSNLQLVSSRQIHNPKWLATIAAFHSVNIGLSIDLQGNINAEKIAHKQVSGRGGSPNFSKGAALSPSGASIVALRTDRGNALVERIDQPTIPGRHVSYVVCEKGIADLRHKNAQQRARLLEALIG
ncbi:MAG: hypothetical protein GYB33_13760 [Gammaproteobacteria bacterium]|nr:hypothetical protein [Gammaproteobacteria bacterium]